MEGFVFVFMFVHMVVHLDLGTGLGLRFVGMTKTQDCSGESLRWNREHHDAKEKIFVDRNLHDGIKPRLRCPH